MMFGIMDGAYDTVVEYASSAGSYTLESARCALDALTPEFADDPGELNIDTLEELKEAEMNGDIQPPDSEGRFDHPSIEELRERRERVENALGIENERYKSLKD
jgi:hypothetical protein